MPQGVWIFKKQSKKEAACTVTMQKALMTFVSSSYLLAGIRLKARLMRGFQYSINCTLNTYTQMENSLSGTLCSLSLSLAHTSKHTCRHMHTLHTQPNDRDLGTSLVYDTFSRCYLTQKQNACRAADLQSHKPSPKIADCSILFKFLLLPSIQRCK